MLNFLIRRLLSSINIYAGNFDVLLCVGVCCVVFFLAVCFAACHFPEGFSGTVGYLVSHPFCQDGVAEGAVNNAILYPCIWWS